MNRETFDKMRDQINEMIEKAAKEILEDIKKIDEHCEETKINRREETQADKNEGIACDGCHGCDCCDCIEEDVNIIGEAVVDPLSESYREVCISFNEKKNPMERMEVVISHDECLDYDRVLIALIEAMVEVVADAGKDSDAYTREDVEEVFGEALLDGILKLTTKAIKRIVEE